jgi:uncharacterized protein YbaR (Trm112 family)
MREKKMAQSESNTQQSPVSEELLAILVCPVSKHKVALSEDKTKLICVEKCQDSKCPREYRIDDGIPVMLVED